MTPLRPSSSDTSYERGAWRPLSLTRGGRLGASLSLLDPRPVSVPVNHISRNLPALQHHVDLVLGIGGSRLARKLEGYCGTHDRLPDRSIFHGSPPLAGTPTAGVDRRGRHWLRFVAMGEDTGRTGRWKLWLLISHPACVFK
jgi:hypothetical protein